MALQTRRLSTDAIGPAGAWIAPGLQLSFQRYARPPSGEVPDPLPSSLGVLPIGLGQSHDLLVPVADNEAFWIGLDLTGGASGVTLRLSVEVGSGLIREIPALRVAAHARVSGFRGPDGRLHCFARTHSVDVAEACNRLLFRMDTRSGEMPLADVVIRLVDYAIFTLESGKDPPSSLDVNAGYGGWRMP